jgi:hypothetical protein
LNKLSQSCKLGADQEKKRPALNCLGRYEQQVHLKDDSMNISHRSTLVQSNRKLHRTTSHVYQTLLGYCHNNKVTCFPSIRDIVEMTNLGERCVQKQIRKLELENLVKTTPQTMPSGRKTTNLYTLVGLKEIQESGLVNTRRGEPRFGTEALPLRGSIKNTYGARGGRSGKKKSPKALILCDLEQSDPEDQSQNKAANAPAVVAQTEEVIAPVVVSQTEEVIAPVVVSQTEEVIAPAVVAQTEEVIAPAVVSQTEEAIAPVVVAQTETAIAPAVVAKSQNKASVRFEGPLTTRKIVEIYNLYTRQGWIRRCCDSFFTFVANCSMAKRLRKRNVYGHLTWVYKNKLDRKLITAKDEELARKEIKSIHENGLMPDLMEPQPLLRLDQSPAPQASAPPPPPARTGSRPAMDWPDRNFPETGKELFLQKYVRGRRVTHVHPKWLEKLNCWIVKCRMVDGKMQYETHPLTEDGWYEVCSYSEIVRLLNEQGVRISQADFIQGLIDANSVLK